MGTQKFRGVSRGVIILTVMILNVHTRLAKFTKFEDSLNISFFQVSRIMKYKKFTSLSTMKVVGARQPKNKLGT